MTNRYRAAPCTSRYAAPGRAPALSPGGARVDDRAAADRRALPRRRAHLPRVGTDGEIHAQDRQDARRDRRRREPHRTVEPVRSVSASAGWPCAAARSTRACGCSRAVPQRSRRRREGGRSRSSVSNRYAAGSGQRVRSAGQVRVRAFSVLRHLGSALRRGECCIVLRYVAVSAAITHLLRRSARWNGHAGRYRSCRADRRERGVGSTQAGNPMTSSARARKASASRSRSSASRTLTRIRPDSRAAFDG